MGVLKKFFKGSESERRCRQIRWRMIRLSSMYELKFLFLGLIGFSLIAVVIFHLMFIYPHNINSHYYSHFQHKKLKVFSDEDKPPNSFAVVELNEFTKHSLNNLRSMLKHAWSNYHKFAWGYDELKPESKTGFNWIKMGLTVVDSLDTLYIMNFTEEYKAGKQWVIENLHFNKSIMVDSHTLVTRILGGLLSIYHLTDDIIYFYKIKELSTRMKPCFVRRNTKLPCDKINLKTGRTFDTTQHYIGPLYVMQMELKDLGFLTNDRLLLAATDYMSSVVLDTVRSDDLVHECIEHETMSVDPYSPVQIGKNTIGYYEGILKMWIQGGQRNKGQERALPKILASIEKNCYRNYKHIEGYLVFNNISLSRPKPYMEEESCKLPGLLALAAMVKLGKPYLEMAYTLMKTCIHMQNSTKMKLCPLSVFFSGQRGRTTTMTPKDPRSTLASSALESLMYLFMANPINSYSYYTQASKIAGDLFQNSWLF